MKLIEKTLDKRAFLSYLCIKDKEFDSIFKMAIADSIQNNLKRRKKKNY